MKLENVRERAGKAYALVGFENKCRNAFSDTPSQSRSGAHNFKNDSMTRMSLQFRIWERKRREERDNQKDKRSAPSSWC